MPVRRWKTPELLLLQQAFLEAGLALGFASHLHHDRWARGRLDARGV